MILQKKNCVIGMELSPLKPRVCGSISESGTQKKNVVPKTYQENFANKKIEKMFLHIFLDKKKKVYHFWRGQVCMSLSRTVPLIDFSHEHTG